ncbi:protein VTE6, chloroplastic isoform X2 [Cryptomeria japonica]|uniref:protein VTE6, chloroplastic isoform X2 n=1 Tax=Cryptomeria japonica TaxID=3369 RepID=UPI0025ACF3DF|nr:protein VTE6, chloroplastic isoform X2 [Cryptomeria japonica]
MATLSTLYPLRVRFSAPSPSPNISKFKLLHKPHSIDITRKQIKMAAVKAELNLPRVIADAVQAFQLYPPTWESAILSNTLIFLVGSPLLFAGLTKPGIGAAFLLGSLSWRAFGSRGFLTVVIYYIIGTGVTKLKLKQKEAEGVAEKRKGRRGPSSVFGSGAAGCLCALAAITELGGLAFVNLWQLGFVASFCTKLSDTVSSEIGKAYGKTTYLITTLSVVPRGTEGAVSIEGTFAGLAASMLLACVCWLMGQGKLG